MNIQQLKDFFSASDYSDKTKSEISQILSDKTEVTPGLFSQVKDILQKELDSDFKEMGIDATNEPELQKIEKEYIEELDKIEEDLGNDMNFVEKELNDLEEMRKQVSKVSEEIEINNIKQSI